MIVRIQLWELAALRIRKTHDQSPIEGMLQTLVAVFTEGERIEEIQCCDKTFLKLYKRLLPISSQHALWVNSVFWEAFVKAFNLQIIRIIKLMKRNVSAETTCSSIYKFK